MKNIQLILIDRIFLDLENPRHEPYENQAEVIEYLCKEEYVYQLAKDIVKQEQLNPLEVFALIPTEGNKRGKKENLSYTVVEGNRRMCAIMLLNDPDLAPPNQRKDFKKLSEENPKISEVPAVIFDNKQSVATWLERIHGGLQGGIGRKQWSSEQKTRHIGDKKNILAQSVLDYAEKNKFISANARKGKLTTVQRYLGNPMLREVLGIDNSNIEDISRNRPKSDFDQLLKQFIEDLLNGAVSSRANAPKIIDYSRSLGTLEGITGKRIVPESLSQEQYIGEKKKRKIPPKNPVKPKYITYESDVRDKLKAIPSFKLEQIYWSLCSIELEKHTPLISVGTWVFFESLTAKVGRPSGTDFYSFLSKNHLQSMGFNNKDDNYSIRQALERISHYGNTTKHHKKSANFNGVQLHNDMDTLKELICKLAEEAQKTNL